MRQRRSTLRADLGQLRDQQINTAVAESRTRGAREERTHPCPLCPKTLRGELGLQHHMRDAHGVGA